ncbi:MAG: radical SAM protein [Candidatus Diapherotrites archaeon]
MRLAKIEIVLGAACNNNCLFCSVHKSRNFKQLEQVKKEVISAKGRAEEICFTGGEPTIRKDIFEIVHFAKEQGFQKISVTTNGRMFSDKNFTEQMLESGLNSAIFSIHGADKETHDFLTQVNGCFSELMQGIKNFKEKGGEIRANIVINALNFKQLPAIVKKVLAFKPKMFCLIFPSIDGNLSQNKHLVPAYSKTAPYLLKAIEIAEKGSAGVWALNVPPCIIPQKADNTVCELKTEVYWFEGKTSLDKQILKGKKKLAECKKCILEKKCFGVEKAYLKEKGENEFKAIKGK